MSYEVAKTRYDRTGAARDVPEDLLELVIAERMDVTVQALRAMDADDVDRQVGYWQGKDVAEYGGGKTAGAGDGNGGARGR